MIAFEVERGAPEPLTDLARRLSRAEEKDRARGMFFLGALDVVRKEAGEAAAARCLAASRERAFVPFFLYPITSFLRLSYSAAGLLAPRLGGFEAAMRTMGARSAQDFLSTVVGRSFLALAGGCPKRLVSNLPSGYSTAVNYGERDVEWLDARQGRITMFRDFMPHSYHEGVVRAALDAIGAREPHVHGRASSLLDSEYLVSWT
ncbi:DUF2378 family protein [Comamonas sp. JC664]|uniref:DUF2378 family protein n=1 Tax=Comamonas sp. JC664 TaxID=2801917 RepID=UPI00174C99A9|nr:DUF2378 family protein [Comamonas sp. JC664]MBL0693321.1 DUF2378 family protein [Comamonas sp. JC664]GHG71858.1 hypothetical protein GCM10012319_17340 [Comamonas sp. KCTC 72670]